MSLDSSSTTAEIVAAYLDNMSYSEEGDTDKAKKFETACRALLLKRPRRVKHGDEEVELDLSLIAAELEDVKAWRAVNDAAAVTTAARSSIRHVDFRKFRE